MASPWEPPEPRWGFTGEAKERVGCIFLLWWPAGGGRRSKAVSLGSRMHPRTSGWK